MKHNNDLTQQISDLNSKITGHGEILSYMKEGIDRIGKSVDSITVMVAKLESKSNDHEERIENLEKLNIAVLSNRIDQMEKDVDGIGNWFKWGCVFFISLIGLMYTLLHK